jgi:hypothetical protein
MEVNVHIYSKRAFFREKIAINPKKLKHCCKFFSFLRITYTMNIKIKEYYSFSFFCKVACIMGATSVMGSPNPGPSLVYYENLKKNLKKGIEIGNETIGDIAFSDDGKFLMIDRIQNGGFWKGNKTIRILINISNFKKSTKLKGVKIEFYGTQEGKEEIEKMRKIIREKLPKEIIREELAELEKKQQSEESDDFSGMTIPENFDLPEKPKEEPKKKSKKEHNSSQDSMTIPSI